MIHAFLSLPFVQFFVALAAIGAAISLIGILLFIGLIIISSKKECSVRVDAGNRTFEKSYSNGYTDSDD